MDETHAPLTQGETSPRTMSSGRVRTSCLEIFGFERRLDLSLPLYLATVPAGFPSPADDYIDKQLDLNEHLVRHPEATFFVRVTGDSMCDAGINDGDILIVDRALQARNNSIIIAVLNGELTVKRLRATKESLALVPEHPDYTPIEIDSEASFEIWGVVSYVIHKV